MLAPFQSRCRVGQYFLPRPHSPGQKREGGPGMTVHACWDREAGSSSWHGRWFRSTLMASLAFLLFLSSPCFFPLMTWARGMERLLSTLPWPDALNPSELRKVGVFSNPEAISRRKKEEPWVELGPVSGTTGLPEASLVVPLRMGASGPCMLRNLRGRRLKHGSVAEESWGLGHGV